MSEDSITLDKDMTLVCEIDHPIFDMIDNITRRQVLRLIACESNYGNRIASILDLSTPAIHRHLKYLEGNNPHELKMIGEYEKTHISYSGKKGGAATMYEINNKVGIFFSIMPNFVHSHIMEIDDDDEIKIKENHADIPKELQNLKPVKSSENENHKEFDNMYTTVQHMNKEIIKLQTKLMDAMNVKNAYMEKVDDILKLDEELEYEDRVILRAVTCLGPRCSSDLSHFLHMDYFQLLKNVDKLRNKGWLAKHK